MPRPVTAAQGCNGLQRFATGAQGCNGLQRAHRVRQPRLNLFYQTRSTSRDFFYLTCSTSRGILLAFSTEACYWLLRWSFGRARARADPALEEEEEEEEVSALVPPQKQKAGAGWAGRMLDSRRSMAQDAGRMGGRGGGGLIVEREICAGPACGGGGRRL